MAKQLLLSEMLDALTEFYENAGFADYYNRVLIKMSKEEIYKHFAETFKEEDLVLIDWERRNKGE